MKNISDRELNMLISLIKVDSANLEHIAKTRKINGSLHAELMQFSRIIESMVLECNPEKQLDINNETQEHYPMLGNVSKQELEKIWYRKIENCYGDKFIIDHKK